jgi:hypothetical protein
MRTRRYDWETFRDLLDTPRSQVFHNYTTVGSGASASVLTEKIGSNGARSRRRWVCS